MITPQMILLSQRCGPDLLRRAVPNGALDLEDPRLNAVRATGCSEDNLDSPLDGIGHDRFDRTGMKSPSAQKALRTQEGKFEGSLQLATGLQRHLAGASPPQPIKHSAICVGTVSAA
jgi:hypothetical protein